MNDRRSLLVAVSCPSAVLAGWLALSLSAYAPALIENSGANVAAVSRAKDLSRLELADVPRAATLEDGLALTADIAAAVAAPIAPAATAQETPEEAAPAVKLASADPVLILPPEPAPAPQISPEPEPVVSEAAPAPAPEPVKLASADPTEIVATDALSPAAIASGPVTLASKPSPPADTVAVLDECFVIEACIDRYLWALYQRTAKEDTIKVQERRAVTIKRKGKTVTVMRSFTKLVDQDFGWKDPKAAERAGMSMMDYVIGGMDKSFKQKLFRTLLAAEAAGLSPGITSAFRDDYRQSIASGLKAASDRSYHGGSTRGGYGHGMAADIVSTQGNNRAQRWVSTEILWKWVDANGKAFGIGRPYLGRDPPHVGPIDGKEYISRRGVATDRKEAANVKPKKTRAVASAKPPKAQAAREQRSPAKPQKSAQSAVKPAT
ncbi:M15 family metallopeptidase domain-containing protein [Bradyrhizobium sp. 5.13L]